MNHRALTLLMTLVLLLGTLAAACSSSSKSATVPTQSAAASPVASAAPTQTSAPKQYDSPPPMLIDSSKSYTAVIHTNFGDITAELFPGNAPITVNNFVFLSRQGFYDGVIFHRVIKGFMIQTGDPTGTGMGGPGYNIPDEPVVGGYTEGTLAMANTGMPNSGGSQFFICDADLTGRLPKNYTIFGRVTSGMDVVHQIASVPVTAQSNGEPSRPTVDVHIDSIEIIEGQG